MSLQIAITTEIHDMNIEDRIIINAPAERIFGHVFNVEHQRLAEYCEPSVIAGASQNLFFRRALLKLFRRLQLGSEFIRFDLTDITRPVSNFLWVWWASWANRSHQQDFFAIWVAGNMSQSSRYGLYSVCFNGAFRKPQKTNRANLIFVVSYLRKSFSEQVLLRMYPS